MTPFGRVLRAGMRGPDVLAMKRALSRAGYGRWTAFTPLFGPFTVTLLKRFQKDHGLRSDGVYGPKTHEKLEGFLDAYGRHLYGRYDPGLVKARHLLSVCRTFDGPYVWGGGHGPPLEALSVHQGLDCSSSVCLALWMCGLYRGTTAVVSGVLEGYGDPGRGRYVTVHAASDHVWIELTLPDGWFRFDTSPHGDGGRGPRVRTLARDTARFVHRHPPGL